MTDSFYDSLLAFSDFKDFTNPAHYTPLPADWIVVITDVENSTRAILEGKYKDVNALGASSIVALLNAARPLKIPFVFGGDGATLCVPPFLRDKVEAALLGTQIMAEAGFGLRLRLGLVEMKTILGAGHQVLVGKFRPAPHYEQAMFKGEGLGFAEKLVKDPAPNNPHLVRPGRVDPRVDFSGFECRWNEVDSPRGEVVTLLVKARARPEDAYDQILRDITAIYGAEGDHHPLRAAQLSLTVSPRKLSTEIRVKKNGASAWKRWLEYPRVLFYVLAGKWMMSKNVKNDSADWGKYKETLVRNTDYRKFDGALRMVISGDAQQRALLTARLETHRRAGQIVYGLHVDPQALITCIISNYAGDHVHFVDGSKGGYALAAEEMKKQL